MPVPLLALIDRSKRRDLRHLEWKVRLFGIGAAMGLGGIWFESSWLVLGGIAVLLVGFVLRFLPKDREPDEE